MTNEEYATRAVKLWLDNDEGSYKLWRDRARELTEDPIAASPYSTSESMTRRMLGEELKTDHEAQVPELEGFVSDLFESAFGDVEWEDIADSMLEDAKEEANYEEARTS